MVALQYSRNRSSSDVLFAFFDGRVYTLMPTKMALVAFASSDSSGGSFGKFDRENQQPLRKPRISAIKQDPQDGSDLSPPKLG